MNAVLLIGWLALVAVSYQGAVISLKKMDLL
jgi:hypothetical protein